jgi:DNA-binding MarR family transcriptional regulator
MSAQQADDRLIDEFETRLREVELVVGTRVMSSWADARQLSVEEARLLLVLATSTGGSTAVHLADLSGIDVEGVYPALGRLQEQGLVVEEQRTYRLTDRGNESIAALDGARRDGIVAYVEHLEEDERRRLEVMLGADQRH